MSKTERENKKYNAKFKMGIIIDMWEHHLGYRVTARKYWKVSRWQDLNYINTVKQWERIYLEEGVEGLMKERQGRTYSAGGTRKGRPPKLEKMSKKI